MGLSVFFRYRILIPQNCPKVTDSKFLGMNFGKVPIPLPIFYYFELIREVFANAGVFQKKNVVNKR